jgi:hypothetical protein
VFPSDNTLPVHCTASPYYSAQTDVNGAYSPYTYVLDATYHNRYVYANMNRDRLSFLSYTLLLPRSVMPTHGVFLGPTLSVLLHDMRRDALGTTFRTARTIAGRGGGATPELGRRQGDQTSTKAKRSKCLARNAEQFKSYV